VPSVFCFQLIVIFVTTMSDWDDSMISLFLSGDEADKGPARCVLQVVIISYYYSG